MGGKMGPLMADPPWLPDGAWSSCFPRQHCQPAGGSQQMGGHAHGKELLVAIGYSTGCGSGYVETWTALVCVEVTQPQPQVN